MRQNVPKRLHQNLRSRRHGSWPTHTVTTECLTSVVPCFCSDGPISIIRPVAICPDFQSNSLLSGLPQVITEPVVTSVGPWCGCTGPGRWRTGWGWMRWSTSHRTRSTCHRTGHRTSNSPVSRSPRRKSSLGWRRTGLRWRATPETGCQCVARRGPCRWLRRPGCYPR